MTLRPFHLPADFQIGLDIVDKAFRYPEHPEWDFTDEERQNMTDQIRAFARWWPFIGTLQHISPRIRDSFHGFMWEEESQPAGLVTCHLKGAGMWEIGCLAVLPQYRQCGIARKLLQTALDLIRQRGGKIAMLGMIEANLPAYKLYEQMGFVKYTTDVFFCYSHSAPLPSIEVLPDGYTLVPLHFVERKPIYELDRRIIPATVAKFQMVEPKRYHLSFFDRLVYSLMDRVSGYRAKEMLVCSGQDVVAFGRYQARIRPGGVNHIFLRCDSSHPKVINYLLRHLTCSALEIGPGRDVEFTLAGWQEPEVEAAEALGCTRSAIPYVYMGCIL